MTLPEFAVRNLPYDASVVSLDAGYANRMYEYLTGNCDSFGHDEDEEPLWSAADLEWAEEQLAAEYGPIDEQ
jgi:hypothetical protein